MAEKLAFTDEQVDGMIQAQNVIQTLDNTLRDYQSYDPKQDKDLPPYLESMDKLFDDLGHKHRTLELDTPSGQKHVYLERYYGEPEHKLLGKAWGKTLRGPIYAAYRKLNISYAGKVDIQNKGERDSDDYTIYSINEPDTALHGLGIIISARMTVKHGLMPIKESLFGDLTNPVNTAIERLEAMASNAKDPEEGERLEAIAETASRQKHIRYTLSNPWLAGAL